MKPPVFRVLLVEDDPEMPEILAALLHGDNVILSSARNATQALEMVARYPYDLVLLDLGLPGVNGLDLLRNLKEAPNTESIPVIILTAWNSTADKLRGFDLGAVDYLTKPYEAAELRARLRAVLKTKHLQDQLTQTNRELTAARIAAESSARAKAEFLATMSHEIRTPMNGITSMAELLLQTPLNSDQQGIVETIYNSGHSLLTIVNDILDFSRVESGKLELEKQPFDLRHCVESALDLLAPKAAEKKLELAYQMEDGIPPQVVGDVTRLRQVLVNLLSNGVKFTHSGEVVLQVRSLSSGSPNGDGSSPWVLHLSVRDTGIGIPENRMARLFQAFTQADASTSRQYGGSGLGLAISRRLVELMGGKMWPESVPGKGSTFHFTIQAQAATAARSDFDAPEPRLAGYRLLIVDDNPTNGRIFVVQTSKWGMVPRATQSAEQALEWLRNGEHFDLAILDLEMEGMDGKTLARSIRALPGGADLPIVMLTPVGAKTQCKSLDDPAANCLTKPIKRAQLHELLLRILSRTKPAPRPNAPATTPAAPLSERLPLNILLCDDNAINQKVALRLLKQLGYEAQLASNGKQALEAMDKQVFDLVFMDVMMPEMGGLEGTEEIRRRQKQRHLHPNYKHPLIVVAMTANAMQGDREKCLQAGMDDYLSKPVRLEDIKRIIERWGALARRDEQRPEMHQQTALEDNGNGHPRTDPASHAPTQEGPVDFERLNEFTDGNFENLRELVTLYLNQTGEQLARLREAVERREIEQVRKLAHSCAGASATCGMRHMVAPLKDLERHAIEGLLTDAPRLSRLVAQEFERVKACLNAHLTEAQASGNLNV